MNNGRFISLTTGLILSISWTGTSCQKTRQSAENSSLQTLQDSLFPDYLAPVLICKIDSQPTAVFFPEKPDVTDADKIVATLIRTVEGFELTTNLEGLEPKTGSLKVSQLQSVTSIASRYQDRPTGYIHFFKIWNSSERIKIGFKNENRQGIKVIIAKQIPKKDKTHWMTQGYQSVALSCDSPATPSNDLPALGEKLSILTAVNDNGRVRIQTVPFQVDFFSSGTVNNLANGPVGAYVPLTFSSISNLGLAKYNLSSASLKGAPVVREKTDWVEGKARTRFEIVGYVERAEPGNLMSLSVYSVRDKEFARLLKTNSPSFNDVTPLEALPPQTHPISDRMLNWLVCYLRSGKMQAANLPTAFDFVKAIAASAQSTADYCRQTARELVIDLGSGLVGSSKHVTSGIKGFGAVEFQESSNGVSYKDDYLSVLNTFFGCNSSN